MFTQILSEFVAASRFETLAPQTVAAAKRGAMDLLAVTLAGSREDLARILAEYVRGEGAAPVSSALGLGLQTSPSLAAYLNGAMAHALDYDDVIHIGENWMGHPSVAVFPAALAVAERLGLSGRDLILAYSVGIEVYAKVGLFCGDQAYKNGWHNTSYIGTMAAAAAAARLLPLDAAQTRRAFGIAGSLAGGLRQNFGTMTKPLHAGFAARGGVEAATLAAGSMTASENIFDGPLSYRGAFSGRQVPVEGIPQGADNLSPEAFAATLGKPWNIADPGLSFKICPSCRATHFGMEAGLAFRKTPDVQVDQIVEVECHVPAHMGAVVFYHAPAKGLEGKFSLEYVLARTLLDGVPKTSDFTDARVNEPAVRALMGRAKWLPFEPEAGKFGVPEFVFHLEGGRRLPFRVEHMTGDAELPVSDALLGEKFLDCATGVLPAAISVKARDLFLRLENVADVRELTALLT